ncbi:MAG: PAS domain S-box protein [Actinobacteria bacterium]|nr:PAS domain S-box protein [Actinomycetota bacterium]
MVRIPRITRGALARAEAAVALVLAGHAALLWMTVDTGLSAWSIAGILLLLAGVGLVGILLPSSEAVTVVRGALAVATAVLVGEATGSLTGQFWAWFMAIALVYPLVLPARSAAASVAVVAVSYGVTVHGGMSAFSIEDAALRAGVLGAIGMAGFGIGLTVTRLLGDRDDAETKIRDVQGVLDAAFESASAGMALLTLEGEIVEANQALADFLGRTPDSLAGAGWGSLIEPQDRPHYTRKADELLRGEIWSFQEETRFVLRDRRAHHGMVGMSLVTDVAGRPRYLLAHVTDITARVRGEAKLRHSEAHYRNLFEAAPAPLFQLDLAAAAARLDMFRSQGVTDLEAHLEDEEHLHGCAAAIDLLALNEAARRLLRVADPAEFAEAAVSGAFGAGYCDLTRGVYRALWDRRPTTEIEATLTDLAGGAHEGVARLAVPEVDGRMEPERALLTFSDRTEAQRSRTALESVERNMRVVLNAAPIVLFAVDRHGVFTLSEGQGLASLGLEPGEVVGRSLFEMYRDEPEIVAAVEAALHGEPSRSRNTVEGTVWEIRYTPVVAAGEVTGLIGVAVDVSDQARASAALEESVRSKDRFVATVSHELRTPLTAVVGFAHELRNRMATLSQAEIAGYVDMIKDQAVEVGDLVEDLLVASRTEQGTVAVNPEPIDLWGEVDAVLAARHLDVALNLERHGGEAKVMGDPMRVRQIVRNLLTNAERHGGRHVTVRVVKTAEVVSLFVIDDGPGVAEQDRSAMFEPYRAVGEDARSESVGLGLSVSRSLARLMGGDLTYVYYRDHSFFEVRLPAA